MSFWDWLDYIFTGDTGTLHNPLPTPVDTPISVVPLPVMPEILLWDTPNNVRHSVRVICDQEGLTTSQKNTLCATIQCESAGFNTKAVHPNYVIKKGVKTLTSTDYGLCQWNDFYHGREISPDEALNNPEKAVRLMCKYWKAGQQKQWVCYSANMYKKYL